MTANVWKQYCSRPTVHTVKFMGGFGTKCSGSFVYKNAGHPEIYYEYPDGYTHHLTPAEYKALGKPHAGPHSDYC